MDRLVEWLTKEWDWKRILVAPFLFAAIWVAADFWLVSILKDFGPDLAQKYPTWDVLLMAQPQALLAAFLEELLFRLLPLCVAVAAAYKPRTVLWVAFLASLIFGATHSIHFPIIATHTVFGLMMSVLFLKCGGCRKGSWPGPAVAITATTVAHGLSNLGVSVLWWTMTRWSSL